MALSSKEVRQNFLNSAEAETVRRALQSMVDDGAYNTRAFYSPQTEEISFIEKHMDYLCSHPKLKTSEYLANLRLMTKRR